MKSSLAFGKSSIHHVVIRVRAFFLQLPIISGFLSAYPGSGGGILGALNLFKIRIIQRNIVHASKCAAISWPKSGV